NDHMSVLRIVANLKTETPEAARIFYEGLLGLNVGMDHGWLITFCGEGQQSIQVSVAREGGAGTEVPDISVEVDNVDEVYAQAQALGYEIVYNLTCEPWGVRRFYVKDPAGRLVNVLTHL